MKISRDLVIKILKYLNKHKDFYFPFQIICKDQLDNDSEFVEIDPKEWKIVIKNDKFVNFELRENLQNLNKDTLRFMTKGFLEKITGEYLEKKIKNLAKEYKEKRKEKLWEIEGSEEFGLDEFIGGKVEAYENCLKLMKKYI